MSRTQIFIGNWKMHKTITETLSFIRELKPLVQAETSKVMLAIPYTSLQAGVQAAEKSNIVIGSQNVSDEHEGPFTGEISPWMLKDAGAEFTLIGHSERRHIFHENNEWIRAKVLRALKDDLMPVLCIGETLEQREKGKVESTLEQQVLTALRGVPKEEVQHFCLAYEPVWAIGTGKVATPEIAQKAHEFCRKALGEVFSHHIASKIPILYGGSVKPSNIAGLMDQPDIDGALIGGASLIVDSFVTIIREGSK